VALRLIVSMPVEFGLETLRTSAHRQCVCLRCTPLCDQGTFGRNCCQDIFPINVRACFTSAWLIPVRWTGLEDHCCRGARP
jgi:hypothetical protein